MLQTRGSLPARIRPASVIGRNNRRETAPEKSIEENRVPAEDRMRPELDSEKKKEG